MAAVNERPGPCRRPRHRAGRDRLGRNILVGFMTWEGYNYEDAVLLNERLVPRGLLHLHPPRRVRDRRPRHQARARGDHPRHPQRRRGRAQGSGRARHHPRRRRGHAGDILVGKVTPKGETDLTAEERLLRAIFGEKAREVRDTSLKVPHGESGIVVDAKVFTREAATSSAPA